MSWNKVSNLLFVESPAGVGWSYSNRSSDYNTNDESTANDMLVFLLRWYEKFPELKSRDLFLTGENYAGHYVPQLAEAMLDFNSKSSPSEFQFNLKGIAIGNPSLKLQPDLSAKYEFFWSRGMISDKLFIQIKSECNSFVHPFNLTTSCFEATVEAGVENQYINLFDPQLDVCSPSIAEQQLRLRKMATKMSHGVDVCINYERSFYFRLPEVQEALHANRTRLPYPWWMCSNFLNYTLHDVNMIPILKRIIQKKTPVWIFSGDEDSHIPFIGSRTLVGELAHDLGFNTTVPYGPWFHKSQVGGWAVEYGKLLTFATVKGAGHQVAYTQPSRGLHLFTNFVRGRRLPNKRHSSGDE